MSLKKGKKFENGYSTTASDEGVNYRIIADTMTEIGFEMNHSSARNHIIRAMRKFVEALVSEWNIEIGNDEIDRIAKNPSFQHGISDVLHEIESERRANLRNDEK